MCLKNIKVIINITVINKIIKWSGKYLAKSDPAINIKRVVKAGLLFNAFAHLSPSNRVKIYLLLS